MIRPPFATVLALILLAWACGPTATAAASEGPYRYIYYPARQVYYAPDAQLWFWREGEQWTRGATLPVRLQQYTRGGYLVELETQRPYEQHQRVVERYKRQRLQPYQRPARPLEAPPASQAGEWAEDATTE